MQLAKTRSQLLKLSFIKSIRKSRDKRRLRVQLKWWNDLGRPVPPPQIIKHQTVLEYGEKCNFSTFVETGTYLGDMVEAVRNAFRRVYSVELGSELYNAACKRFAGYPHVTLLNGSSAEVLPQLLGKMQETALFWLDAHYSGGVTAKGDSETPINAEIEAILRHKTTHIILIDDARCFNGLNDYPSLKELINHVKEIRPDVTVEVRDDIIRIVPRQVLDAKDA